MWTIEEEQELQRLWAKKCAYMQEQFNKNMQESKNAWNDINNRDTESFPMYQDYVFQDYVKFWPNSTDWLYNTHIKGTN